MLVWIGGGPAFGQEQPDTTETAAPPAAAVPSAPLDTVRAADVAPPDTSAPEKAIVRADSLSALTRGGERLQELFGDVRVRQDTTRLRSRYGLRYLNRDELLFTGDVVIYERGDTLRADTVWYNKRTKVGRARSNVRLTDGEVVVRAPEGRYYTEEKRSVFPDSVTLVDSSRVLRAQRGTYWSNQRRAEFSGAVELTDPETYLTADSLAYFRDQERSIATGSVFIRRVDQEEGGPEGSPADTSAITYLFGEWADNQEQKRYSRVERQALLVRLRLDSTGAPVDTFAIRAQRLEAQRTDTYRRLVAVDSVRIWQTDLAAVADSAVYDRVLSAEPPDTAAVPAPTPTTRPRTFATRLDSLVANVTPVGTTVDSVGPGRPRPVRASTRAPGAAPPDVSDPTRSVAPLPPVDSAAAVQRDTSERRSKGWGLPSVTTENALPLEDIRLFRAPVAWFKRTQAWGDSIRVRARERRLDTVYVRGAAFAAQLDTTVERIRQLKGKDITAVFRRDSLRKIIARPNGQAIYFSAAADGTLNGATRASADVVEIRFANGDVRQIAFGRGVQGTAYHKKKHIPDPFRLEGFQWTPERRPNRDRLLREKRVRERLTPESPKNRKQARSPVARTAPDRATEPPGATSGQARAQRPRVPFTVPEPEASRRVPRPDSLRSTRSSPRSRPSDSTDTSNVNP